MVLIADLELFDADGKLHKLCLCNDLRRLAEIGEQSPRSYNDQQGAPLEFPNLLSSVLTDKLDGLLKSNFVPNVELLATGTRDRWAAVANKIEFDSVAVVPFRPAFVLLTLI
jgi:hypothetical protein